MGKFASGKRSKAISDRSGMEFPYDEMVKEWNGSLVHFTEFEPKHPQIRRRRTNADAIALQNARPMKFQQPTQMQSINTLATSDITIVSSGGATVCEADLTLPGDFAFRTEVFTSVVKNPGDFTTTVSSMAPEDPSVQNRRRELVSTIGKTTVSIT
jgi:hypothetical protein|tara:strand:+ start:111 stop:578 length:468 start_codon:yes stop_codon:yes gene_type:complete